MRNLKSTIRAIKTPILKKLTLSYESIISHHRMHQTRFHHHLILVLSNHQDHRQVPILIWSHPHFPRFSHENNQALLERGSINSGFHVTGEIRPEGIYLQMDLKMEDCLNQL